ncbi:MAG: hypothetical protein K1X75_13930 [Leptospirales bacterium]|nr:hypothetical protein [Leptospirales bacterium]
MIPFARPCGGALLVATLLSAARTPAASPAQFSDFSHAELRSLRGSRRSLHEELLFRGLRRADTGRAYESVRVFEDAAGRTVYFLSEGFENTNMRTNERYRLAFRIFGFAPGGQTLAQLSSPQQDASDSPYEGDIRENDPRLDEIRKAMQQGQTPPASIRLRYSGVRGDYLSFFDLDGREALFRYREDRFDRRAERRIAPIIAGQAYEVRGNFLGLLASGQWIDRNAAEFGGRLGIGDSTLVFEFVDARPLRLDQALF